MKIKTVVENENGTADFAGQLTASELQFVVDIGMNFLLSKGVTVIDTKGRNIVEGSEELQ